MPFIRVGGPGGACDRAELAFREVALEELDSSSASPAPDGAGCAVSVRNDLDVHSLDGRLDGVDAVILHFPAFTDGRAYSQARVLRAQLGFRGDIIARGDVGRDQALFMARAGFSLLEVDGAAAHGVSEAMNEFSSFYQAASDGADPVWRLRATEGRGRAAA
ncbi:MAG: DUF934 domain-containing protein [Pseudomonadota bacterium]